MVRDAKTNQMTAGIYIRKSRQDKDGQESQRLTVQRKQLPAYAHAQGWQTIIYDDGHASAARGKIEDLKERGRLEADIRASKINIVLTIELSRLSRDDSMQDYVAWLHLCSQHRVKLATMSRTLDPAQHSDWMLLLMEGGFSSMEMKVLQGRMKEGRDQAFRAGKFLGGQAPPPYRYDRTQGRPVIDPALLPRMQQVWQMAETVSVRSIAEQIREPLITVRRMLADDRLNFYQAKRLDPKTGNVIDCDWEPCLTADQAERIRANRVSRKSGYNRKEFAGLLSNLGLLTCGYCGSNLRAWRGIDNRSGKEKPYAYYGCKGKGLDNQKLCAQSRMVNQDDIDHRVITNLISTLDNLDDLKAAWQASQENDDTGQQLRQLQAKTTALQTKKQRIVAAIAEGVIDFADAKHQRQQIEDELAIIRQQQTTVANNQKQQPPWDDLQITREEFDQLDPEDQRELISLCIEQVQLYQNYMIITYQFPRDLDGTTTARTRLDPPKTPGKKTKKAQ